MFTNAYENKIPGKSTILFALMLLAGSMAAQNLQLTFSTQPPTCFGYTNGTATVTASGGSGQYLGVAIYYQGHPGLLIKHAQFDLHPVTADYGEY